MKVLIFGASQLASLCWHLLTHDSRHEVVGFTVDAEYLAASEKHGLPVVPFETLERHFPPGEAALISPLGWHVMRGLLAERHHAARARGYSILSHVSSHASTWPEIEIGEGSIVFDGATIEAFARLGPGTIVRGSCHISHDVSIAGSCYLAPGAILGGSVRIDDRCFVGTGAIVQSGVHVARGCFIAAGARLTRDTEEDGVYDGSPAVRRTVPASRMKRI